MFYKTNFKSMVVHACSPSTSETEARELLEPRSLRPACVKLYGNGEKGERICLDIWQLSMLVDSVHQGEGVSRPPSSMGTRLCNFLDFVFNSFTRG